MRREEPVVAATLAPALEQGRVLLSTPVLLELLRSARDVRQLAAQAKRYDFLHVVPTSGLVERRARDVQTLLAWRGYHRGPSPVDLLAAAAAESVGAELWHCDRHFELIAEVTGQPMRRVGE
jgi:predicted nucleic acid-binding protein